MPVRAWRHALQAALILFCPWAASIAVAADSSGRPRTCLVLGGGGARGAAHIGVLKVLERERVPVDCVVGTSMGAIVGGLYASGYTASEIETALRSIDWVDIFHDDPPREDRAMRRKEDDLRFLGGVEIGMRNGKIALPQGVVQGQKLLLVLRRLLLSAWNVNDFDELPLPFRCVAADIIDGEKIVFSEGDVATGIRASMSVPGAFAPIRVNGRLLVDGGMVDNVPVDEGRKLGGERLIVVAVGSPMLAEEELTSPFALADQMVRALMKGRSEAQLATLGQNDVLIVPELGAFSAQHFDRAGEAIEIGHAAAEKSVAALRRLAVSDAEYARFQARHRSLPFDPPLVQFLDVQKEHSRTAQYVEERLAHTVGKPLDITELEQEIDLAYGEGSYESVSWRLEERDSGRGLAIEPADKSWGPDFLRFGLRLSDDFDGRSAYQLLGEIRFTGMNPHGGYAVAHLQTGRILNGHVEFYQPWGKHGHFSAAPYLDYRALNIPLRASPASETFVAEIRRSAFVGGVELGFNPDNRWRLSLAVERGHEDGRIQIGPAATVGSIEADVGRVRPRIEFDSLDDAAFPARGMRIDLSQEFYSDSLGSDAQADVTRGTWDAALSSRQNHVLLGVKFASAHGGDNLLGTFSTLGGLANVSGYTDNEIVASQVALARGIYYRRLTDAGKQFSLPIYAGGSIEAGGWWDDRDDIDTQDLIAAGSVFIGLDTILGPVFFGYGRAERGVDSFYLRFGPLLRTDFAL